MVFVTSSGCMLGQKDLVFNCGWRISGVDDKWHLVDFLSFMFGAVIIFIFLSGRGSGCSGWLDFLIMLGIACLRVASCCLHIDGGLVLDGLSRLLEGLDNLYRVSGFGASSKFCRVGKPGCFLTAVIFIWRLLSCGLAIWPGFMLVPGIVCLSLGSCTCIVGWLVDVVLISFTGGNFGLVLSRRLGFNLWSRRCGHGGMLEILSGLLGIALLHGDFVE